MPASMREWLPADHLVYFISDVVDHLDLSAIMERYQVEERGYPPCHPAMIMISHRLIGHKISSGELSRCSRELFQVIENWRNRYLSLMRFKYLFCDGIYFEMRVASTILTHPYRFHT